MSVLTSEEIKKLAHLCGLTLTNNEQDVIKQKLSETLTYVHILDELDTSKVDNKIHMSFTTNVFFEDGTENTRQLSKIDALKNAPNTRFEVPKVLEEK